MQQANQAVGRAPFGRMYLIYAGIYLACIIGLVLTVALFNIDPPSSLGTIMPGISALVPGYVFVSKMRRRMTRGERAKFAIGASVIAVAALALLFSSAMVAGGVEMSLAGFAGVIGLHDGISAGVLAAFIIITMAVSFVLVYFFVNMMGKHTLKALERHASGTAQ